MSYCSNCGAQLEHENVQFCSNCGAQFAASYENNPQGYYQQDPNQGYYQQNPAQGYYQQNPAQGYYQAAPVAQPSMKWFKFLINFALFAGAVINIIFGLNYITGGIYMVQTDGQVTAEMVYSVYGMGVKALDMFYGLLMLAVAGYGIYTRFQLAKYKANGPKCLYILYGAGLAVALIYNIGLLAVTGVNQIFTANTVSTLVTSVLMIVLNRKYFANRAACFVN